MPFLAHAYLNNTDPNVRNLLIQFCNLYNNYICAGGLQCRCDDAMHNLACPVNSLIESRFSSLIRQANLNPGETGAWLALLFESDLTAAYLRSRIDASIARYAASCPTVAGLENLRLLSGSLANLSKWHGYNPLRTCVTRVDNAKDAAACLLPSLLLASPQRLLPPNSMRYGLFWNYLSTYLADVEQWPNAAVMYRVGYAGLFGRLQTSSRNGSQLTLAQAFGAACAECSTIEQLLRVLFEGVFCQCGRLFLLALTNPRLDELQRRSSFVERSRLLRSMRRFSCLQGNDRRCEKRRSSAPDRYRLVMRRTVCLTMQGRSDIRARLELLVKRLDWSDDVTYRQADAGDAALETQNCPDNGAVLLLLSSELCSGALTDDPEPDALSPEAQLFCEVWRQVENRQQMLGRSDALTFIIATVDLTKSALLLWTQRLGLPRADVTVVPFVEPYEAAAWKWLLTALLLPT